jgi:hypothetical protein
MEVIETDIDPHDDLVRDYGMRVPVVRVAGEDVAEGHIKTFPLWWKLIRLRLGR